MDAVKYLREAMRMCNSIGNCEKCPFGNNDGVGGKVGFPCKSCSAHLDRKSPEKVVAIVEKWSDDHPAKTRQSEFLKLHPNAKIMENGTLAICPKDLDERCGVDCNKNCDTCRNDYWLAEVKR